MIEFIDQHREAFGVEPICAQLPIAPATSCAAKTRPPSARALSDAVMVERIHTVDAIYRRLRQLFSDAVHDGLIPRSPVSRRYPSNSVPERTWGTDTLVVGAFGRTVSPYTIESAFRLARSTIEGLPEGFRVHDLRHYYASLLILSGLDIKTVQTRLRHASAKTTLDVYGHMWPDKDETSNAAVAAVFRRSEIPEALELAKL